MMSEPALHHVGHVVASIADSLERWRADLGAVSVSEVFEDPIQKVRAVFLGLPPGGAVQFELLEPAGADSPVASSLTQGGGLHHLCFEVDDLDRYIAQMRALKVNLVRGPQPAVAFNGRRIAWMLTRERLLVEYLERRPVFNQ